MRVEGAGYLKIHGPQDEGPHPSEPHPWWNESVWLHFLDAETNVYGIIRIGHQPHSDGGVAPFWTMIGVPGAVLRFSGLAALGEADRLAGGFGANGTHLYRFADRATWQVRTEGLELELALDDDHPPLDYFTGEALGNIARNHIVASGRVNGAIRLAGSTYHVREALGVRDQSWGPRLWHEFRSHRWVGMNFGRDCSATALTWLSSKGDLTRFGFVRRGEVIHAATDVDILAFMEPDGITNRGGIVTMTLACGDVVTIRCEPVEQGLVSTHHGQVIVDTISRASLDGRDGVACFETTNNSSAGTLYPAQSSLVRGVVENGLRAV